MNAIDMHNYFVVPEGSIFFAASRLIQAVYAARISC
jgi:hypothetical protein